MNMSKTTGLDRAVEYVNKLESFRQTLERSEQGCVLTGSTVGIEPGRKYDRVYIDTGAQRLGRYMVDRHSWAIYGIKSWAQVNLRRIFGTLDTVHDYDWSGYHGTPRPGTASQIEHDKREVSIKKNYLPRGRPRKN